MLLASGTVGTSVPNKPVKLSVSNPAVTALQAQAGAMDSSSVSINLVGTVASNWVTAVNPAAIPGLILLNGAVVNGLMVPGVNPMAGPVALAVAHEWFLNADGQEIPPLRFSTADTFLDGVYPTDSARFQMRFGGGTIGIVNPLVTLEGVGMNIPEDVAEAIDRERKKR